MKKIMVLGMVMLLACCGGVAKSGVQKNADPIAEGWYSPDKTDQQLHQDMDQCKTKCLTA